MSDQHTIVFLDSGRDPEIPPNPQYPTGKFVDASYGTSMTCDVELPYPAPRWGVMFIKCSKCGLNIGITVAGRPDDPSGIRLSCKDHQLHV
jgi:hypothetical protein